MEYKNQYSVINGFGTYGGYDPMYDRNTGLLEMMSANINGGDSCGYLTADDIIKTIFGRNGNASEDH